MSVYKIKKWVKNNKMLAFTGFLVLSFIAWSFVQVYIVYSNNYIGDELSDSIKRLQIVTIPISALGVLVGFLINQHNKNKAVILDKAKATSEFVKEFRELMIPLETVVIIWERYFEEGSASQAFKVINDSESLHFDKKWFSNVLSSNGLDYKGIVELVGPKEEENLKKFYEICTDEIINAVYSTKENPLTAIISRYQNIIEIKRDITITKRKLENYDLENDPDKDINTEKKNHQSKKDLSKLLKKQEKVLVDQQKVLGILLRRATDSLVNDLECLCVNVKFGLISYDQVYHLIIQPFEHYIKVLYFQLMISIISGEKKHYKTYSNIVMLYEQLISIRIEILSTHEKHQLKASRKLKEVIDNDHVNI